jgi:L-aspartate oxidase
MKFDVVIVGSGLAGLSVALHLAQTAQGRHHLQTRAARRRQQLGAGRHRRRARLARQPRPAHRRHAGGRRRPVRRGATRYIVEHSREAIEWLIEQGVPFTRDASAELGFHLTREGGHSQRRIIHAADATGHAVQVTLEQKVRAHPNITLFEHHCAVDVITSDKLAPAASRAAPAEPRHRRRAATACTCRTSAAARC